MEINGVTFRFAVEVGDIVPADADPEPTHPLNRRQRRAAAALSRAKRRPGRRS